jgi:hypothetical protein
MKLPTVLCAACLLASAGPAHADATAYFGTLVSGAFRPSIGFAVGRFMTETGSIVGFEIDSTETRDRSGTDIWMFGGSLLAQSKARGRRPQFYGALGTGIYGQVNDDGRGSGLVGIGNVGGGVKFTLAGPLKIRLDYRFVFLGSAEHSSLASLPRFPQRATAGLSLAF